MSRDWVTSDWHLGHTNIAGPTVSNWKTGYRNFESVHEMNRTIIDTINHYVAEDDTIWFDGDFCFGGHYRTPEFRRQIMCKNIHIIRGNHDAHIDKYQDFFSSIQDYKEINVKHSVTKKSYTIVNFHYALRVWAGSHRGVLHAYGHSHGSLPGLGRSIDVGIDNIYKLFGEYRPITTDEFIDLVCKNDIEFPDHHSAETNTR